MTFAWGLICAVPALIVWGKLNSLGAGIATFAFFFLQGGIYFFAAIGTPWELWLAVEGYAAFLCWWSYRCLWVMPHTIWPIVLNQTPSHANGLIAWLLGQFALGSTPTYDHVAAWVRGSLLVGVSTFLCLAWRFGAPNPYGDPARAAQSQRAMERNAIDINDPRRPFQSAPRVRPRIDTWVNTGDVNDWSQFVREN